MLTDDVYTLIGMNYGLAQLTRYSNKTLALLENTKSVAFISLIGSSHREYQPSISSLNERIGKAWSYLTEKFWWKAINEQALSWEKSHINEHCITEI